jgi:hypothetical protein
MSYTPSCKQELYGYNFQIKGWSLCSHLLAISMSMADHAREGVASLYIHRKGTAAVTLRENSVHSVYRIM